MHFNSGTNVNDAAWKACESKIPLCLCSAEADRFEDRGRDRASGSEW